jgi:PadR family transcriptional regulator PadR
MTDSAISSDLIRGHIDTIALGLLASRDRYGYEIVKEVAIQSEGAYELKEPTLYSALRRMEAAGLVTAYWGEETQGGRRKYYSVTAQGREVYQHNVDDWKRARVLIDRLVSGSDQGGDSDAE